MSVQAHGHHGRFRRLIMLLVRMAGALVALLLASGIATAQGAKPTDPQIAHIAYTAGQIDIQAAEQALQKSKNKDVLAFANDMVRDHKAVNDKALALVKKLNVTPQDNDTSKARQAGDRQAGGVCKAQRRRVRQGLRRQRGGVSQNRQWSAAGHAHSIGE
jgi:hypothetical protein